MEKRPVAQDEYSENWITSAWGDMRNAELLKPGPIRVRPRVARAIELAEIEPGLSLLDIACGRAEVPAIACRQGAYAVGLDYSEASVDFARRVQSVHGGDGDEKANMELVQADACSLPFADNTIDRITMLDIVEHLAPKQLEQMFREVRRTLRPDGFAVIHTLPNRWVYDVAYPLLHRIYPRIPADPRSSYERKIHVNEQDLPKLGRMLTDTGLKHRLWLEQQIPAQARWNAGVDCYKDTRDKVYPLLSGPLGNLLELISVGPLKLLLCNDIFGILWKGVKPQRKRRLRWALTERLVCSLSPKHHP